MTNFVPGVGPKPCDIMIVGEAPGAEEDKAGIPFIGRAGKRLTEALEAAGMDRSEVYITNIFKYRPPNNRTPTPNEIVDGMEILAAEIYEVRPKFLLLLGNTALSVFGPWDMQNVTRARGVNLSPDRDHKTYATFHPAATLYSPQYKEAFFEDISDFVKIARSEYTATS